MTTPHDAATELLSLVPTPIPDDRSGDRAYAIDFARDAAYAGEDWEAITITLRMLNALKVTVPTSLLEMLNATAPADYVEEVEQAVSGARKTLTAA